ncbi:MAG: methyltransferase domain-containing protein [Alphaproteobacteria bacterium]|nr:methyltransferase domain-containing protein [Alphaproteobacteria bacterium]
MTAAPATIATWHKDRVRENAMGPAHAPIWRHFIDLVPEGDLSAKTVLDFGCNQGGFLRMLHAVRPFRRGLGVDIAADSVARAQAMKGDLPIDYAPVAALDAHAGRFDIAFSHEVIYLVPDIAAHAQQVWAALRPGGVYYAVTGCHTGNKLWPRWRTLIAETTNVATQDRSLDDYGEAFRAAGFEVGVKRFGFSGFAPYGGYSDYYPTLEERIYYYSEAKTLFRLVKEG